MSFTKGLNKVAVSLGWLNKATASGVASRMGKSIEKGGPRIGHLASGLKEVVKGTKAYQAEKPPIMTRLKDTALSLSPRTHYKDLSPQARKTMRSGAKAYGKAFPKE